jgi:outer membrane protein OmpA-like peptidoglycan-associated protein
MDNKWRNRILAMIAIVIMTLPLSGCGSSSSSSSSFPYPTKEVGGLTVPAEDYKAVVLVIGNTANQPVPEISNNIEPFLNAALMINGFFNDDGEFQGNGFAIVSAAGSGSHETIVLNGEGLKAVKAGGNEKNNKKHASTDIDKIKSHMSASPSADSLDFLGGIKEAVHQVEGVEGDGKILLVLIGSGLNDVGPLNFASYPDLINQDPSTIVSTILENPDTNLSNTTLEGFDVVLSGLGETVPPQPDLENEGTNSRENVRKIYEELVRGLGGNVLYTDKTATSSEKKTSVETSYTVTPTILNPASPLVWKSNADITELHFTTESLNFNGDEATFVDPAAAASTLNAVVDEIKGEKNVKISIVGYTASTKANLNESENSLSTERANAVRDILVNNLGVDSSLIVEVRGAGTGHFANEFPYGPGGDYDYAAAVQNRVVVVTIER